jgi:hypothetical protein
MSNLSELNVNRQNPDFQPVKSIKINCGVKRERERGREKRKKRERKSESLYKGAHGTSHGTLRQWRGNQ